MAGFFETQANIRAKASSRAAPPAGPADGPDTPPGTPATGGPMTVAEFASRVRALLRAGFPARVLVRGEASNVNYHHSGALYFDLKDGTAVVNCVVWGSDSGRIKFTLGDGQMVIAHATVDIFARASRYQLKCYHLEPEGQGALELARRQLEEKLRKEGLFEPERKKPLPIYPRRIVLVTSKDASGCHDMLKVLATQHAVQVAIAHVAVQGNGAAEEIAAMIDYLSASRERLKIDLIITGRGGGSAEDLFEFNREVVARAIARCGVPVITGIGHEPDVHIADLVADYHAHTPTEAARYATRHWHAAPELLANLGTRLVREIRSVIEDGRQSLAPLERSTPLARPRHRLEAAANFQHRLASSLQAAMLGRIASRSRRLDALASRLSAVSPQSVLRRRTARVTDLALRLDRAPTLRLPALQHRLSTLAQRLQASSRRKTDRATAQLDSLSRQLTLVSPNAVLARGYTITTTADGKLLTTTAQARAGTKILTRVADGIVTSIVPGSATQGILFGDPPG